MAKKRKNIFEITAYYSGNTCIIDEKHSYKSCEILCKLFNYNADKISEVQRDLKRLLQLLLFKLDDNYDAWKNYDSNVYKTQAHLNWVKDLLLKMPLYKHITHLEDFDYQDLINCLNRHTIMFDRHYNDMCLLASERDEEEKKLDYDANSEYEEDLDDYEDDADDDGEDFDDLSEHYSFYEAPRYESRDLGFNDSLVLEDNSERDRDLRYFRPEWKYCERELEDHLGAELLNRDLRDLIEPYVDLLDTLVFLKDTYGRFLDDFVHSKGRYLTEDEIAILYEKYTSEQSDRKIIHSHSTMSLVCKTVKLGNKSVWCDVYTFDSLSSFLYFDFFRGLRVGYVPKRCEHCGKFFLLTAGRYYDFCERVVKGTNGKTCRDIGAHKKYEEKCKSDPVWLAYNRAYKAHYARLLKKKMTKSEFLTWSTWAADYRDAALCGKVRIEEYEKKIKE